MQVIEEFIHIVGLGMKDFHNAYLMTGNLGKKLYYCYSLLSSYLPAPGARLFVIFVSPPPPHPRPGNQTGRVGAQYSPTKFPFPSFCSDSIGVILVQR